LRGIVKATVLIPDKTGLAGVGRTVLESLVASKSKARSAIPLRTAKGIHDSRGVALALQLEHDLDVVAHLGPECPRQLGVRPQDPDAVPNGLEVAPSAGSPERILEGLHRLEQLAHR